MLLIPDEQKEMLREDILKTCLPIRPIRSQPKVIRIDSAPGFKSHKNDEFLQSSYLNRGRQSKKPYQQLCCREAVQDIERELLKVDPTGSQVSSASLMIACCALNSRLGSLGFSPRKVLYHPDQSTNECIHFDDIDLIDQQYHRDAPATIYTANDPRLLTTPIDFIKRWRLAASCTFIWT